MNWFRRLLSSKQPEAAAAPAEATVEAKVITQPLVVGPLTYTPRIAQALYRIDAITRYIDQCAEEGVTIKPEKMIELESERLHLSLQLRQSGVKV